jgi:hypothetical protein
MESPGNERLVYSKVYSSVSIRRWYIRRCIQRFMYSKVYSNVSIRRCNITILSRHLRSQDVPHVGQEQQNDVWSLVTDVSRQLSPESPPASYEPLRDERTYGGDDVASHLRKHLGHWRPMPPNIMWTTCEAFPIDFSLGEAVALRRWGYFASGEVEVEQISLMKPKSSGKVEVEQIPRVFFSTNPQYSPALPSSAARG